MDSLERKAAEERDGFIEFVHLADPINTTNYFSGQFIALGQQGFFSRFSDATAQPSLETNIFPISALEKALVDMVRAFPEPIEAVYAFSIKKQVLVKRSRQLTSRFFNKPLKGVG